MKLTFSIYLNVIFTLMMIEYICSQLFLNEYHYEMDTSLKRTPGVGFSLLFFGHFSALKLPIRKTTTVWNG